MIVRGIRCHVGGGKRGLKDVGRLRVSRSVGVLIPSKKDDSHAVGRICAMHLTSNFDVCWQKRVANALSVRSSLNDISQVPNGANVVDNCVRLKDILVFLFRNAIENSIKVLCGHGFRCSHFRLQITWVGGFGEACIVTGKQIGRAHV